MPPLRIIAIVAAYNEADIIERTTRDLVEQGIEVYLLDHGSTDGTADRIRPLLGHGVRAIESVARPTDRPAGFRLADILRRKEELVHCLEADWFINHDADELRESPWNGVSLRDGLTLVDRLGWNAVDFAVLNFVPVDDGYQAGDDLRAAFEWFTFGPASDRLQIRCWKKQAAVDLVATGGHEARFAGRAVFPIRFLLRHYPIRSQAHGERKVFVERLPRFDVDERERGWHVQYDNVAPGHVFIHSAAKLNQFDPEHARIQLQLHHRGVETLSVAALTQEAQLEAARSAVAVLTDGLEELTLRLRHETEQRETAEHDFREAGVMLDDARARIDALEAGRAAVSRRLSDVLASRSWRWTGLARRILRSFPGI